MWHVEGKLQKQKKYSYVYWLKVIYWSFVHFEFGHNQCIWLGNLGCKVEKYHSCWLLLLPFCFHNLGSHLHVQTFFLTKRVTFFHFSCLGFRYVANMWYCSSFQVYSLEYSVFLVVVMWNKLAARVRMSVGGSCSAGLVS